MRRQTRILQITKGRFPPEIRVVKEGLSLSDAGYNCAVLCPPYGDQVEYEVWMGIEVFRPRALAHRTIPEKIFEQAALFSPVWYQAIRDVIEQYKPDVLHVHDIWLGRATLAARTSQRLVMDLHENMPAAVVEYLTGYRGPQQWFRSLFHRYSRIFRYERRLLTVSDMVLVVVREASERVLRDHPNVLRSKVVTVENLESKRFVAAAGTGRAAFEKDHFSVLYIGGFGPHRGLDTLVRAMVPVRSSGRAIKVQLIGAAPSQYLEMLKVLIDELDVARHVQISGWVAAKDALANIQQADVCCVPHHSNPHTDTTIPHKLFQYMIARRPVLVSSSAPLARSVLQAGAGLVFTAGDPDDCARQIIELADDPEACARFADNGYRYVMEQGHNWEDESAQALIAAYERLVSSDTT